MNGSAATTTGNPLVATRNARLATARTALLYLAAWVPLAVMYGGLIWSQAGGQMPLLSAARAGIQAAVAPAVLGLGIWWLSARLAWPERRPAAFIAVHLALSFAFAILWTAWEYMMMGAGGRARMTEYVLWRIVLPWSTLLGVLLYGVIAGVSYALRGAFRSRDLRVAAEKSERLRAQAELAVLRAHINPHFLFNTLHTVTQLLRAEPARAEAALERLSDLFRYVLRLDRHGVELVSLEDEWHFAESYLWLEQLRMGERLKVEASLDDEALACAVPPFTLQPLVENAVRHGLGPKREGGRLRVVAHELDGSLVIEVSDDGKGADATTLESGGIGVRAVRERLRTRHGDRAKTEVTTRPGAGFRVVLTLPAEPVPAVGRASDRDGGTVTGAANGLVS